MPPQLMTKTEFAAQVGVGKSAVSNWIERGIISGDGIVGEGRRAKINVAVAVEQVRRNRDIGQSLGNGIVTRTTVDEAPHLIPDAPSSPDTVPDPQPRLLMPDAKQKGTVAQEHAAAPAAPKSDTVEDQLKRAKLEEQLRRNRLQASEEALRQGKLMDADDARDQMARIAGMMLQIFEGSLPDFASAMAAQFDVPQRDVLHLLRAEFKNIRKTAATKERARANDVDKGVTASVNMEV